MLNMDAMRQAAQQEAAGGGFAVQSYPAPLRGLNRRDGLDAMDPLFARELTNWYPGEGRLEGRKGFAAYGSGVGSGDVETLIEFDNGPTNKLLAAGGGAIYDVSSLGAGVSKASGFSNDRWQGDNFAGNLGLVNGADAPQIYDGSTVSAMTITATSLTKTDLIGMIAYKSRTYFWERSGGANPRSFWYSALGAMGGAVTEYNLGTKAGGGGYIVTAAIWSRDSGNTMDDLLVFFMSTGKVLVYSGSNPGDSSDWSLVGDYKSGVPLGVRCIERLGGEIIIGTKSGYLPLSGVIQGGKFENAAISDNIRGLTKEASAAYASNFGWSMNLSDDGGRLLINVPKVEGEAYGQHVVNLVTGAWCEFDGIPARCWANYNGKTYFGAGGGLVREMDNGFTDAGAERQLTGAAAYTRPGGRGTNVHVKMIKPYVAANGNFTGAIGADVDFRDISLPTNIYTFAPKPVPWEDIAQNWNAWADVWSSEPASYAKWYSAKGVGGAVAPRMTSSTDDNVYWYATDVMYEIGGHV